MGLAQVRHHIEDRAARVRGLADILGSGRVFTHPADLLAYGYDGSVLTAMPDLVVFPESTEEVSGVVRAARRHRVRVANVFHAGDGNLHPIIPYDASNAEETGRVLRASEEMLAACVAVGGSLSGEHGIGIEKNNYMPWVFSDADLDAQRRLKAAFDPEGLMNPFKVFPTPISCGELMARKAPRLAASGLWI